ncbi:MAG: hypothetical protein DRJ65_06305 [Acidobacteria bacterium]|nr:MAG: hypothetical protein DRJ65_06305 [Acidobacteriota bacterium]
MAKGRLSARTAGYLRPLRYLGPVLLVYLSAVVWTVSVTNSGHSLPYDAFRDTAWSQNMLEGEVWSDPSILGAPWWYSPAGPALMASIAAISGQETPYVHAQSSLWLNPLILTIFFILMWRTSDFPTAVSVLPLLLFGSLWWMTHIAAAMPSIQGVVPALLSLLLWSWCVEALLAGEERSRTIVLRGVVTGLGLAVTAWWHPVCALVVAGALGFHVLGLALSRKTQWRRLGLMLGSTVIPAALLTAPLLVHILTMVRRNPVPFQYVAPEMSNPAFAIGGSTPAVGLLAIVGLILILKDWARLGWLPGFLAIALIGQAPAYLSWWRRLDLPVLVPHEFQWQGQLAIAALAAIGLVNLIRFIFRHFGKFPGSRFLPPVVGGFLLIGSLAPAFSYLPFAEAYLADVDGIIAIRQEVVDWIKNSTDIDDVIACPAPEAYMLVGGLTGRKCVALPAGHTNPSVDASRRLILLSTLQTTPDEWVFLQTAQGLNVHYVLVTLNSVEAVDFHRRLKEWPRTRQVFSSRRGRSFIFEVL